MLTPLTLKQAHNIIRDSGMTTINAGALAFIAQTTRRDAASLLNALYVNGYLDIAANDGAETQYKRSKWFNDDSRLK